LGARQQDTGAKITLADVAARQERKVKYRDNIEIDILLNLSIELSLKIYTTGNTV